MDSFGPEDPQEQDVRALQAKHLAFARGLSPGEHVHALDVDGLADPAVTLYGLRRDGVLLGVGALKRLDDTHVEVKSMTQELAVSAEVDPPPALAGEAAGGG